MTIQPVVTFITAEQTLPLRHSVLKPHLRLEECVMPEDYLSTSFHLGVTFGENIVSVATFILERHPDLAGGFPYRLRGMATEPKYQRQGMGAIILQEAIVHLKNLKCDLLWCNARKRAFPFYEALGFQYYGPMFEMKDIGPHKVMYKHLIPR
jgi:hypothetical protein